MWMRHVGGHERSRAGDGQLNTQANRYVLQLGGDLAQWSSNAQDRWHLGVMAGYANQHSNTQSNRVGYKSDGRISGYSAGLYATWYQNDANKTGAYVDSWALYNWFDNSVSSDNRSADDYDSRGVTASVEGGYTFEAGTFSGSRTVIGTDAVIKPVIQRPAVNISAGLIRIVLIPGRVQPSAVTADAPIRFITHTITLSITVLIGVACHHAKMPAILRVATPLRQIAA